jgi:hypothetical protein
LLLTGCLGERGAFDPPDPLRGGAPIPPPPNTGLAGGGASPYAGSTRLPPVTPAHTATSPAALTSAGELRLSDVPPGPAGGARAVLNAPRPLENDGKLTAAPGPGATPAPPAPGVTLAGGPQPALAGGPVTLETANFEQLQAMLAARNVTWQRLEVSGEGGEWKFSCAIPNRQNPSMRRNYEARAVGPYGLPAIRAAILEIDRASGLAPASR